MNPGFIPLLALILAAGISAFGWETEGFRVLTSRGARLLIVERRPLSSANVRLRDQGGKAFSITDYRGRPVLVDFIYTHCPSGCEALGEDLGHVLKLRPPSATMRDPELLSISFDPKHDNRGALKDYADRFGAIAPRWRVAAPDDPRNVVRLLKDFGVVVLSDGNGGFMHDDDLYLVDARGRLTRTFPSDTPPKVLAAALETAGP